MQYAAVAGTAHMSSRNRSYASVFARIRALLEMPQERNDTAGWYDMCGDRLRSISLASLLYSECMRC